MFCHVLLQHAYVIAFPCCTADICCADGGEKQGFTMPSTGHVSTACTSINLPRPDQYISPDLICHLQFDIHLISKHRLVAEPFLTYSNWLITFLELESISFEMC